MTAARHILHSRAPLDPALLYQPIEEIGGRSPNGLSLLRRVAQEYDATQTYQLAALHAADVLAVEGAGLGTTDFIRSLLRAAGLCYWPKPLADQCEDLEARREALEHAIDQRLINGPATADLFLAPPPEPAPRPGTNGTHHGSHVQIGLPPASDAVRHCSLCHAPMIPSVGWYRLLDHDICAQCWGRAAAQQVRQDLLKRALDRLDTTGQEDADRDPD